MITAVITLTQPEVFSLVFEYTPTEYEVAFKDVFQSLLSDQFGQPVVVEHDVKLTGDSGQKHQIDAMATVSVAGFEIRIIVECKRYTDPVSLDRVLTFKARICLLYTSPSPRDATLSRMPSSA